MELKPVRSKRLFVVRLAQDEMTWNYCQVYFCCCGVVVIVVADAVHGTRPTTPRRRWQQNWQFPTKKALDSALQLSAALSYLHSRAVEGSFVVHRDLKPENIAFSPDGRLKLFGKQQGHAAGPTAVARCVSSFLGGREEGEEEWVFSVEIHLVQACVE